MSKGIPYFSFIRVNKGFSGGSDSKESACNAGDLGSIAGLGRSPGEGNSTPAAVLQYSCLENPHGQRSLAGCSSWDCKELGMTEHHQSILLHLYCSHPVMSLNHALTPLHPILSANLSLSWTSELWEIHYCCLSHPDCRVWQGSPIRPIHHSSQWWSWVRQYPSPPSSHSSSPSSQQVLTRGSTFIITARGGH